MQINDVETCVCWFGANWGAAICRDAPQVPTPVHQICRCGKHIAENDDGLLIPHWEPERMIGPEGERTHMMTRTRRAWHLECAVALMIGPHDAVEVRK
jgi:hypothetical protein